MLADGACGNRTKKNSHYLAVYSGNGERVSLHNSYEKTSKTDGIGFTAVSCVMCSCGLWVIATNDRGQTPQQFQG